MNIKEDKESEGAIIRKLKIHHPNKQSYQINKKTISQVYLNTLKDLDDLLSERS